MNFMLKTQSNVHSRRSVHLAAAIWAAQLAARRFFSAGPKIFSSFFWGLIAGNLTQALLRRQKPRFGFPAKREKLSHLQVQLFACSEKFIRLFCLFSVTAFGTPSALLSHVKRQPRFRAHHAAKVLCIAGRSGIPQRGNRDQIQS